MRKLDEIIEDMSGAPARLADVLEGANDEVLDRRPAPDEWSPREVLAHLRDAEGSVMRRRLHQMLEAENPALVEYDNDEWARTRDQSRDAVDQLLSDFTEEREKNLELLRGLTEADLDRPGQHPFRGGITAGRWLEIWHDHDQVHLEQIESAL